MHFDVSINQETFWASWVFILVALSWLPNIRVRRWLGGLHAFLVAVFVCHLMDNHLLIGGAAFIGAGAVNYFVPLWLRRFSKPKQPKGK